MDGINISNLNQELMNETIKLISSCQEADESFVAWLGHSPEEIKSQLYAGTQTFEERCLVAIDKGSVCGFLGMYISDDQATVRLLGPYVSTQRNWHEIAVNLLSSLKTKIPASFKTAKVAFFKANVNCKRVYTTNHFTLYNAEKTMILNKEDFNSFHTAANKEITTRYYQPHDFNRFIQVHPSTAYFTGKEVVDRLSQYNRLIVAEIDNTILGYVYFEMLKSERYVEICFLNVSQEFRSRGIGILLISKALDEAFKYDWIESSQISVRVNNQDAERLYKRIGYHEKNVILALQRDLYLEPWDNFI